MKQYNVMGMSCAACSARVEKAVNKLDGVTSCAVSLLTNSMGVEGTAKPEDIIKAVENAGYGASLKTSEGSDGAAISEKTDDGLRDRETPLILKRLVASVIFLLILMYFSMGHTMLNFPLPPFFSGNHLAVGMVQLLLSAAVMVINQRFFISGFKGLVRGAPNMDTLVALGAAAAFGYSVYALFAMTSAVIGGDNAAAMEYMHEMYFESAAMILTLITVGKMLEARSKGRTTNALKSLMKLTPKTAVILHGDVEETVPVQRVQRGVTFIVRPGESIPVDGIVRSGSGAVNEAALTGESMPSEKTVGDEVSAGTINLTGFLRCEATNVGEDTAIAKIIRMVSDAAATKAPIAKAADKVSGVFVPVVIGIAVVTIIVWLIAGQTFGYALARGISVLVISCPCALGLATPVAIMVGSGKGAKNGILFKTASALEITGKTRIAMLDKTGTITDGAPEVTDIFPAEGTSEAELLSLAHSLEQKSEHPLAGAVVRKAKEIGIVASEVDDFRVLPGSGLAATLDGIEVLGGNLRFIGENSALSSILKEKAMQYSSEGKTPLLFARGKKAVGVIAAADKIKPDSAAAIQELKNMGIRTVMLTGDNERTANAVGASAGVDEVIAGVLPDGKEAAVRSMQQHGRVAMVGDGINDAPALTRADTGIAIGAGTDVAIDAADVVLMNSSLSDAVSAIKLSRATLKNIKENLFWAFIYNIIGIPLAAGVWIPLFGWQLNPMFGAAAMSLSSFCVVMNALRLNLIKLNKNEKLTEKEKMKMEKVLKINGMMCGHCEARVKKALEAVDGVAEANVSHESGTATVKLSGAVADEALKQAVEAQDYTVTEIKQE